MAGDELIELALCIPGITPHWRRSGLTFRLATFEMRPSPNQDSDYFLNIKSQSLRLEPVVLLNYEGFRPWLSVRASFNKYSPGKISLFPT